MPAELQLKKKKKKNGKKKKQDTAETPKVSDKLVSGVEDETEVVSVIKLPKTSEDGTATFSSCSKTLFFAFILGSSGLAILSISDNLNLNTFGQADILAQYGKESLLPNWQGFELDFVSVESLGAALGAFTLDSGMNSLPSIENIKDALEEYGNAIMKRAEDVSENIFAILQEVCEMGTDFGVQIYNLGAKFFSAVIDNSEEAYANAVYPFSELSSAFHILIDSQESASDIQNDILEETVKIDTEAAARLASEAEEAKVGNIAVDESVIIDANDDVRLSSIDEDGRLASEEAARVATDEAARISAEEATRLASEEAATINFEEEESRLASEEDSRIAAESAAIFAAVESARLAFVESDIVSTDNAQRLVTEEGVQLASEEAATIAADNTVIIAAQETKSAADDPAKMYADEEDNLNSNEGTFIVDEANIMAVADTAARIAVEQDLRLSAEENAPLRLAATEESVKIDTDEKNEDDVAVFPPALNEDETINYDDSVEAIETDDDTLTNIGI